MKAGLFATSAIVLLCAAPAAYAQDSGPKYDKSIHQSAGDRDSRGTPKYYHGQRHTRHYRHHRYTGSSEQYMRSGTTGAGSGPTYENTIHQSAGGRDSRGNPKFNKGN